MSNLLSTQSGRVGSATRPHTTTRRWVRETRLGRWFIGTKIWERYVVAVSMQQFVRLLAGRGRTAHRVLDAGSGPGASLPLIDEHFKPAEIVALDVDPFEVERSRVQSRRCGCRVDVHRGDVAHLEFPNESFDLVVCHQTLHHVVEQEAVLREFHRVLAPGGALLIAESCRSFILSGPVRALFRHPNEVQKTAGEYQQLIRAAGFTFTADDVETTRPFWSLIDWGLLERLGWQSGRDAEPTQVTVVAFKPAELHSPSIAGAQIDPPNIQR